MTTNISQFDCQSIINWQRMKFQKHQIVWAKHPQHQLQWPGKVNQILPNKCLQIAFYHFKNHYDVIVTEERDCRHFKQCQINSKDSPPLLYEAYQLAKKDYAKLKQTANEWNTERLKSQIDSLLVQIPKEEDIERLINSFSRLKLIPNQALFYFKERFCQKLAYLVREESLLDSQLKYVLNSLRLTMKTMLIQAFKEGQL